MNGGRVPGQAKPGLKQPELKSSHVHDVIIVGSGPAGMSAAIYAAADGMDVLVLDKGLPGGQMRHSPQLENVPGHDCVSGEYLATKMAAQAGGLGARFEQFEVSDLHIEGDLRGVRLGEYGNLLSRTVVVASGAWFRRVALATVGQFEGKAVFYHGVDYAGRYVKRDVVVVGGGNASAQNVLELAMYANKVTVLVRSSRPTWSHYLDRRICQQDNVEVRCGTYLDGVDHGNGIEAVTFSSESAAYERIPCTAIYILTGQVPQVEFVKGKLALHGGRIATGANVHEWADGYRSVDKRHPLETSVPGIFAIGDCRDGSGHGVGAAIGDGNNVVTSIWDYLSVTDPARVEALLPARPQPSPSRAHPSSASSATPK